MSVYKYCFVSSHVVSSSSSRLGFREATHSRDAQIIFSIMWPLVTEVGPRLSSCRSPSPRLGSPCRWTGRLVDQRNSNNTKNATKMRCPFWGSQATLRHLDSQFISDHCHLSCDEQVCLHGASLPLSDCDAGHHGYFGHQFTEEKTRWVPSSLLG